MSRRRGGGRPGGQLRIIAGAWRGRRLPVPAVEGLRPTPDRVRETLFNWLGAVVPGARCLDLFAGSGALGFEAASRGAARVVLVERDPRAAAVLTENRGRLGGTVEVIQADALHWLAAAPATPFDVVFLDPPYGSDLLARAVERLLARGLVAAEGWIYLEDGAPDLVPPAGWSLIRQGRAGQVHFALARRD